MSQVEEISDIEQLADYRLAWTSLLARTPGANYFQSLDWLTAFWRNCGHGRRLRTLLVYADGGLVGILPLMVTRETSRLGRLRVLAWPLDGWGTFYGPIGPWPAATLALGFAHLARSRRDWDILDLRWLPEIGWDRGRTETALRQAGLAPRRQPCEQVAFVDLSEGWDHYWRSRTGRWRQRIRVSERRVAALGQVEYLRCRPRGAAQGDDDPHWDLYEACGEIARRSWQHHSTIGNTLSHVAVRDFLRDAHQAAARAGAADINLLLIGGRPVAFVYGYFWEGEVYNLRTGFDPEICGGAGSVLIGRMLRDSHERGDRAVNLGADYLEWKRYWASSIQSTSRLTCFAGTSLRAQAIRLKRALEARWITKRSDERSRMADEPNPKS